LSIRLRFTLYICLLFTVVMVAQEIIVIWGVPFSRYGGIIARERSELFKNLNLIADLKERHIREIIEEQRNDLRIFSSDPDIRENVALLKSVMHDSVRQGADDQEIRTLLKKEKSYQSIRDYLNIIAQSHGVYHEIFITDTETSRILASTREQEIGTSIQDENIFLNSRSGAGNILVTDIHISPRTGQPVMYFCRPIEPANAPSTQQNKAHTALFVMGLDPYEIIRPLLRAGEGLGPRGEAILVNEEVKIVTPLKHPLADGSPAEPLVYQIETEPAVRAARGDNGTIETNDYREIPVLAAYRHVRITPEWGWGMVIKRDRADLFAPLYRQLLYTVAHSVVGILVVIGVTMMLISKLTQPLLLLSQAASKVSEGVLEVRAPVSTSDEVGRLALTFNNMIQRLQYWYKELENQVRARTSELNQSNMELQKEIVERKRVEKELERLNRNLEEKNKELEMIIYVASHDLRSPLVNIQGFCKELAMACETLNSRLAQPKASNILDDELKTILEEDIPESLHYILAGAAKMDALLGGLLRLSRLGKTALTIRRLDVNQMIDTILRSMEFQIKQTGAQVQVQDLPACYGDSVQIPQVFSNLLDNALKYLDPDRPGLILISGRLENDHAVYCIQDNGRGISKAHHQKIFEIFQRLQSSTVQGEGLGLTIADRIVERHGGEIWLDSELGVGSCFYVKLPTGSN